MAYTRLLAALLVASGLPAVGQSQHQQPLSGQASKAAAVGGSAASVADIAVRTGFDVVDLAALEVSELEGMAVYDMNDQRVGEVDEVIVGVDGTVEQMIIEIGGLLGFGEVAIARRPEEISVQYSRLYDITRVYIPATWKDLEQDYADQ